MNERKKPDFRAGYQRHLHELVSHMREERRLGKRPWVSDDTIERICRRRAEADAQRSIREWNESA